MGLGEHFNNSSEEVEIKIIKRKRISEENGIVMLDWEGTGNGDDVPDGYEEVGSISDPSLTLWKRLANNGEAMEDYIWSRDYIDALTDFSNINFSAQQLLEGMG